MRSPRFRADTGDDPELDAQRHRTALAGIGERDLYGAGGWHAERGVATIDVMKSSTPSSSARGPKGYVRSDARIYEDVCELLAWADEVDASDIEVSVKSGEVTLSGTVPERGMKMAAEMMIDRIAGVIDIHNRVRVVR
jgi:osmotically-inducible protein OsmY